MSEKEDRARPVAEFTIQILPTTSSTHHVRVRDRTTGKTYNQKWSDAQLVAVMSIAGEPNTPTLSSTLPTSERREKERQKLVFPRVPGVQVALHPTDPSIATLIGDGTYVEREEWWERQKRDHDLDNRIDMDWSSYTLSVKHQNPVSIAQLLDTHRIPYIYNYFPSERSFDDFIHLRQAKLAAKREKQMSFALEKRSTTAPKHGRPTSAMETDEDEKEYLQQRRAPAPVPHTREEFEQDIKDRLERESQMRVLRETSTRRREQHSRRSSTTSTESLSTAVASTAPQENKNEQLTLAFPDFGSSLELGYGAGSGSGSGRSESVSLPPLSSNRPSRPKRGRSPEPETSSSARPNAFSFSVSETVAVPPARRDRTRQPTGDTGFMTITRFACMHQASNGEWIRGDFATLPELLTCVHRHLDNPSLQVLMMGDNFIDQDQRGRTTMYIGWTRMRSLDQRVFFNGGVHSAPILEAEAEEAQFGGSNFGSYSSSAPLSSSGFGFGFGFGQGGGGGTGLYQGSSYIS